MRQEDTAGTLQVPPSPQRGNDTISGAAVRAYQICSRCVMDTTDSDIMFDAQGVCNHCYRYEDQVRRRTFPAAKRAACLASLVRHIKAEGARKEYDCIIGVSGGVDSTYVAHAAKRQLGLRPLAVHFDNGWNSELAVSNIEKTLNKLAIDLYTYVVDWEEFRDLQLSFLKASTPDGEVPTDHAIVALLYQVAARRGIRHILLGTNVASESVMPLKWGYGYSDFRYIKNIHRVFGSRKLRTYPHYTLPKLFEYMVLRQIKLTSILDYMNYEKEVAMRTIQEELGWVYYGGKHYESIYTRFYQAYVLPRKFGIDKRRAHYSNLVLSSQMTRETALSKLAEPIFPEHSLLQDLEYVTKKLSLRPDEFEELMRMPARTFMDYETNYTTLDAVKKSVRFLKRMQSEKLNA